MLKNVSYSESDHSEKALVAGEPDHWDGDQDISCLSNSWGIVAGGWRDKKSNIRGIATIQNNKTTPSPQSFNADRCIMEVRPGVPPHPKGAPWRVGTSIGAVQLRGPKAHVRMRDAAPRDVDACGSLWD